MQPINISNEKQRTYIYAGQQQITVPEPSTLIERGKVHIIQTASGNTVILAPEWLAIDIVAAPPAPADRGREAPGAAYPEILQPLIVVTPEDSDDYLPF
jgi:hypothetical protein